MRRRTSLTLLVLYASATCIFTLLYLGANQKMTTRNRPVRARQKVILLAYMRSGSSLTGDILQQHRNVFYVFEPLWTTEKYFLGYLPPSTYKLMDNTTLSVPSSPETLTERYTQVLDSFLNCRLDEIDVATLTQYFMSFSLSTKDFLTCAEDDKNLTRISLCIKPMITACQQSRAVILKVIRSRLLEISSMFTSDPQVNIIHLVRDPRGALMSQRRVGMFEWTETKKAASEFCQRIYNDICVSRQLSKMYPNRILTVRYEDIADFPLNATRKMYTFLNLKTTTHIEQYVWNITYGGHPDGCAVCINRSNAKATANRWRRRLPFSIVNTMQRECINISQIMGYRTFNLKKEMRNLTLPARFSSYSEDLVSVQLDNK